MSNTQKPNTNKGSNNGLWYTCNKKYHTDKPIMKITDNSKLWYIHGETHRKKKISNIKHINNKDE